MPAPATCGPGLVGRPVAQTGLASDQCASTCGCGAQQFVPVEWTPERIDRLLQWTSLDTPPDLSVDPYSQPAPTPVEGVCGAVIVNETLRQYRLQTFPTEEAARAANAKVTHLDPCGACSTLADLAVYAREPDLGRKVQDCGVKTLTTGLEANVTCLSDLGFTPSCARIWAYNTRFTRTKCFSTCFPLLEAPYHLEDGGLNACLECDERESGPIFKAVAGRTRRNTGIPSAICRPCAEVRRVTHEW